ncbi:hypothetical protein GOODEAATRI_033303 [Goodea atripinnis]|uniref:Uncharacterized protein n=1 Tax=Goodea atripinnis TaxID=208336 RepID=A0ABV0MMT1_9TELE
MKALYEVSLKATVHQPHHQQSSTTHQCICQHPCSPAIHQPHSPDQCNTTHHSIHHHPCSPTIHQLLQYQFHRPAIQKCHISKLTGKGWKPCSKGRLGRELNPRQLR